MEKKEEKLKRLLAENGPLAIAFSGGTDSVYLLQTAADVLGTERVLAITARALSFPRREEAEAEAFCKERGIRRRILEFDQLGVEGFRDNPVDRCYLCKRALFVGIKGIALEEGLDRVAEGSNVDDMGDYRPGLRAITELGVLSPLREAGLTKEEIRALSRRRGLPTWEKPSFACLATRFVYGEPITEGRLVLADRAEQLLRDLGFHQLRVRIHGAAEHPLARIEVPALELSRFLAGDIREQIVSGLKALGFSHVSLDLEGYRTGSMNVGV